MHPLAIRQHHELGRPHARTKFWKQRFWQPVVLGLVLVLPGLLTGCGRHSEDTSGSAAGTGTVSVAQPPPEARNLAVPDGASTDDVLRQMNRELLKWIVANKRVPASFEEFVASANLTVPPPPAGKHYVIGSDKKIVLK